MNWHRTLPAIIFALTLVAVGHAQAPRAERADSFDVRRFGALGDGEHDDTAAIQQAIDARIGEVRFPPGTYRLTKTVAIELDRVGFVALVGTSAARIIMDAPGPAFRFVGTHAGSAAPAQVMPNVWQRQRMPQVDGLAITGNHDEACGIEADGTMQLTISRVHLRGLLHGVRLSNRNRNVLISACHIYENRGVGVLYDHVNLHQSNISASHISYNAAGGVVVRGGNVRNVQISGCDIEGNMGSDGPPTANVLVDTTEGTAGEVAITGCTIQHTGGAPGSANVRFIGRDRTLPTDAEKPVREGKVTIADNVMSDVAVNIELSGGWGVTVVGNTLWEGFEHDLVADDCRHLVVSANTFERNPRYAQYQKTPPAGGIVLRDCQDCNLSGLDVHAATAAEGALVLQRCRRINVTGCSFVDCVGPGVVLSDTRLSRVSDCLIHSDGADPASAAAIRVTGGAGNMIVDNLVGGSIVNESQGAEVRDNFQPPAP